MQSISQRIIGGGDACILKPTDYFLAGRRPPQITKKTTALRQSSGELAGARMSRSTRHHRGSAVVTLCVVRINTTEVTPSSKHPANVIRPFVANMQSISQKIIGGGDACILKPNDYFLAGRRPPQITKKRRPPYDSRLVNSLGLEPRTPTLKVLCSTC